VNGPEHYRAAEKLMKDAMRTSRDDDELAMQFLAAAQVHATLALAAATALAQGTAAENGERVVWRRAAGVSYNDVHAPADKD
jgi:hypothetical protein